MDLLTVVAHELGHVLGYDDITADGLLAGVMADTLDAGERLLQSPVKKAKRGGKPAQALVFDEKSGEFVNPGKKRRSARTDRPALQFEPAGAGAGTSSGTENNGWIIDV